MGRDISQWSEWSREHYTFLGNAQSMNAREARHVIYDEVAKALQETDFRLVKKREGFVRKIKEGIQVLGIPLWSYPPRYDFSLHACIRLDCVEDVVNQFSRSPDIYHTGTYTTSTLLEYFTSGKGRFSVKTEEEIVQAVQELTPVIQGKILPFFDEHQTVCDLDMKMNPVTDNKPIMGPTIFPWKQCSAITLAFLSGNPNIEQLIDKYLEEMKVAPEKALRPYRELVDYLLSKQEKGSRGNGTVDR